MAVHETKGRREEDRGLKKGQRAAEGAKGYSEDRGP
jgi:hypothetical protein